MKGVGRLVIALGLAVSSLATPLAVFATADSEAGNDSQVSVIVPTHSQIQGNDENKEKPENQGNNKNQGENGGNGQGQDGGQVGGNGQGGANGQGQGKDGGQATGNGNGQGQSKPNGDKGNQSTSSNLWTQRTNGGGEPTNGNGRNANHYESGEKVYLGGRNLFGEGYSAVVVCVNQPGSVKQAVTQVAILTDETQQSYIDTSNLAPCEYRVEILDASGKKVASDNFRLGDGTGETAIDPSVPSTPPTNPNDPNDPSNLGDPSNPAGQETSNDPADPSNPGNPSNPDGSSDSTNPGSPTHPGTVGSPSNPGVTTIDPTKHVGGPTSGSGAVVTVASAAQAPGAVILGESPVSYAAATAKNLPKAGLPAFTPLFLLAGSLLTGIGYSLRRLV